jgi:hypothetical protein
MNRFFPIKLPDCTPSAVSAYELAATHSHSPKANALHTRNSINHHIMDDLQRNTVPFPQNAHVAVAGYFMDPLRGGWHAVAPGGYVKEAFLENVVGREAGVELQDHVTKGVGSAARTTLLLVDSVLAPFAPDSKSRKNAAAWNIPVMCYAQYLATYYCLKVHAAAAPAAAPATP